MINVDPQQLIQALDADTRRDLEGSAERRVARRQQGTGGDLLLGLLERPQDRRRAPCRMPRGRRANSTPRCKRGASTAPSRNPVFRPELVQWLQDALLAN